MHTQAFMMPKACLSQPHLLPLRLASLPWCPQPRGPPAATVPQWGWGDLELQGLYYLPSCIGGGACRSLIPVGIGAIRSDPPSLLLGEGLVSLAGAVGQRPLGSSRDRTPPSGRRRWDGQRCRPPAESVLSKPQSSPTVLLIRLIPFLPWACFLSPQRHCVALRRGRCEKSEDQAVAWGGREGQGLQRN